MNPEIAAKEDGFSFDSGWVRSRFSAQYLFWSIFCCGRSTTMDEGRGECGSN
jgi:hypothetical protein